MSRHNALYPSKVNPLIRPKGITVSPRPLSNPFAEYVELAEKAAEKAGETRGKRHPALVTADRLQEDTKRYARLGFMTVDEVKLAGDVWQVLTEIGTGQRVR